MRNEISFCSISVKLRAKKKTISFSFGVRNVNFASDKTFLTPKLEELGGPGVGPQLVGCMALFILAKFKQQSTTVNSRESSSWPAIHFNSALR